MNPSQCPFCGSTDNIPYTPPKANNTADRLCQLCGLDWNQAEWKQYLEKKTLRRDAQ